jgi:hypothetical protein
MEDGHLELLLVCLSTGARKVDLLSISIRVKYYRMLHEGGTECLIINFFTIAIREHTCCI